MSGYPDNNPKTTIGVTKAPLHLVPPSASYFLADAFADGARKYGPYNWREHKVSASVYVAAAKRHIDAWWDGEDLSADANVEHMAHAMACMAIILDAKSVGMLNDDRPALGAAALLQAQYAARKPEQYGELIPHARAAEILRDMTLARIEQDDDAPGEYQSVHEIQYGAGGEVIDVTKGPHVPNLPCAISGDPS